MNTEYACILTLVLLFTALIAGCNFSQQKEKNLSKLKITATAVPITKESCEALGGKWEKIGLASEESCNLPTSDAGKVCSDSSECEGSCLAELTADDLDKISQQGKVVYTEGKCSPWRITAGCNAFVTDGKVESVLCVD